MSNRVGEGWYLMNTVELEQELARHRGETVSPSTAIRLTVDQALDYRDRGNLPDHEGRTLRLVLHVDSRADLLAIDAKRLTFEPDYHDPPNWRREGSAPVNVVPLRTRELQPTEEGAWWEEPGLADLENEWRQTGRVAGLKVPGSYRGFVYKTVLALRRAGLPITADTVAGSVARWLPENDAAALRHLLTELNQRS
jgi:hypothetical protein